MSIRVDDRLETLLGLSNLNGSIASTSQQPAQWTNINDYWNRRKKIEKQLRQVHPLYRYPISPYSKLTKVVLNAKSTARLDQLSQPKHYYEPQNLNLTTTCTSKLSSYDNKKSLKNLSL